MTGKEVEDHAVVIAEYPNGVFGTIETGFVNEGMPFQLEVSGTEGTLLIENTSIRLNSSKLPIEGWWTPDSTSIQGLTVPDSLPSPMEQWMEAILHNKKPTITKEDVLNLTRVNEAARLSQQTGTRQQLH